MPRRATPLSPDDGPQARFALALRQLRDRAGFSAPTVESIAARNGIPKSTLYAAMRGQRIPTVPVLAALVRAWGGDPTEWTSRRTSTNEEIERLRLQGGTAEGPVIQAPAAAESGVPADSTGSLVDGETELWNDEISALLHSDRKVVASSPAIDDYRFHSDVEAWKSAVHETSAAELANMLDGKGRLDPAMREAIWAQLRYRAGAPSIHEIAHRAGGISQKTVSRIMRGGASNLAPIVKIALVDLLPDGGPE